MSSVFLCIVYNNLKESRFIRILAVTLEPTVLIFLKNTLTGEVLCATIYHRRCLYLERSDIVSIASDLIRGHTDTIILARLMGNDNYGYEINKSIQQRTDGKYELKEATLYTAFRRLEQAGCISSYWGNEQTGARRRYYTITESGRETYHNLMRDWKSAKEMIDKLIETEDN